MQQVRTKKAPSVGPSVDSFRSLIALLSFLLGTLFTTYFHTTTMLLNKRRREKVEEARNQWE